MKVGCLASPVVLFAFTDRGKWKKRKEDPEELNDDDPLDDNEAEGVPDAAKNDVEKQDETALEDEFGAKDYRSQMILKPDFGSRPLWVVRRAHRRITCSNLRSISIYYLNKNHPFRRRTDISFWNPSRLCTSMLTIS